MEITIIIIKRYMYYNAPTSTGNNLVVAFGGGLTYILYMYRYTITLLMYNLVNNIIMPIHIYAMYLYRIPPIFAFV